MATSIDWVLLVECYNMAELHVLRATLEAHGVPCQVQGEHTHGVLGPIQGAMARSRVLVPRRALEQARALAEDIVGPFDDPPGDEADEDEGSPFRTPAPLPADEPGHAEPIPRRKSYVALLLVILMLGVGPLFGFSHLYVGRNAIAGCLAVVSIFAIAAASQGAWWALGLLVVVWVADLVGGAVGIAAHNRRVAALEAAHPEPDEPEDQDPEDQDPEDQAQEDER